MAFFYEMHLQKLIDDNSGRDVSAWISAQYREADAGGKAAAEERGNQVILLSEEETEKWKQATAVVIEEWVKELGSKGKKGGQQLVDEARALVNKYTDETAN